jgi:hypothetical protein
MKKMHESFICDNKNCLFKTSTEWVEIYYIGNTVISWYSRGIGSNTPIEYQHLWGIKCSVYNDTVLAQNLYTFPCIL